MEYENGERQYASLMFGDCDIGSINKTEFPNVAMYCEYYSKGNEQKNMCALYFMAYKLKNKELKKIVLPECTNMHIFAMSILN